jgi:hypothetical protein
MNGWEGLRENRGLRERPGPPGISLYVLSFESIFMVLQSSHCFKNKPYLKRSLSLKIDLKAAVSIVL